MKPSGLVIVYTGEGKGKTTAALGLALRAAGYRKKVLIVQFGKASFSGELESIKLLPTVKIIQKGRGFVGIAGDKLPLSEHKKTAEEALDFLYKEASSNKWDIIIADELIGAVFAKLLGLSQVLKLIKKRSGNLDLVLTGHHAHPKIIALADLVTMMHPVKHPFEKGVLAKEGIDY